MTRFGWFECLVLVAFFFTAMAAFLTGGMVWVGWVAEVFLWTSFLWLARVVVVEYWQDLIEEWEQSKLVREWQWRKLKRLKGME